MYTILPSNAVSAQAGAVDLVWNAEYAWGTRERLNSAAPSGSQSLYKDE